MLNQYVFREQNVHLQCFEYNVLKREKLLKELEV